MDGERQQPVEEGGDPDRAPTALEPVVEEDAGDLAALAGAGTVAEKPATAEANGILSILCGGRNDIERVVDRPRAGEITACASVSACASRRGLRSRGTYLDLSAADLDALATAYRRQSSVLNS
jgi:hypothetical protein